MFQYMQSTTSEPPSIPENYLATAMKYRPPIFQGGTDPVVLDDWQYKMANIFRYIGCPDDKKVEVAIQFLDGSALQWWRSRESTLGNEGIKESWDEFIKMMRDHFFTVYHYDTKRSEFINLRQGTDMSVDAYHEKFIQLMQHAPEVVSDEDKKVRRFREGLLPEIRRCCMYIRGATLSEMYGHALSVEQSLKEERRHWQGQGKGSNDNEGVLKIYEEGQISGTRSGGSLNALRVRSPRTMKTCWNCGEVGHFHNKCPQPFGSHPEVSRPGSSGSRQRKKGRANREG